jgi:hypothetical protein
LKGREIGELALDGKKRIYSTRAFDFFFPFLGRPKPEKPAMPEADRKGGR